MIEIVLPEGWRRPPGYSEGIIAAEGRLVHVAGQFGVREGIRAVDASDDFAEQWRLSLGRVRAVVERAGGAVTDINALRVYTTDLGQYRSSLEGIAAGFGEVLGRHYPAITMVQVSGLLDENALVEIEAFAVIPKG